MTSDVGWGSPQRFDSQAGTQQRWGKPQPTCADRHRVLQWIPWPIKA